MKKVHRSLSKARHRKEVKEHVRKLRDEFATHGEGKANVKCYHVLDTEIK